MLETLKNKGHRPKITGDTDGHTETTVPIAVGAQGAGPLHPVTITAELLPADADGASAPIVAELVATDGRPAKAAQGVPVGQRLKNPVHERFCRLALEHTLTEAYRRAMGDRMRCVRPSSVWEQASRLAARPDISRRIAELRAVAARQTAVDVAVYAAELRAITLADPSELQYHPACRHCHAPGHHYQWIDAQEWAAACVQAVADGQTVPDTAGGFGYDGSLHPNPDCPRCFGAGAPHLFTADVTRLSPQGRALFKGFGKNGELLMHSQLEARAQFARILGLDKSDAPSIARAAAAGAAAGAALGASVADALTPQQKMQAYLRMIEG